MKPFDRCKRSQRGQYSTVQRIMYLPRKEYDLIRRIWRASSEKSASDFMLRVLVDYCRKAAERMDKDADHRKTT